MKRALSALPRRRNPSAMLAGMETALPHLQSESVGFLLRESGGEGVNGQHEFVSLAPDHQIAEGSCSGPMGRHKQEGVHGSMLQVSHPTGGPMNAFYEHHKDHIRFGYRCFDGLLLNGL